METQKKYCPKCNKIYNTSEDEYCMECGSKLTDEIKYNVKTKISFTSSILRTIAVFVLAACILSFILYGYILLNVYDIRDYIEANKMITITICAALSAIAVIVTGIEGSIRNLFKQQNELLSSYFNNNKE